MNIESKKRFLFFEDARITKNSTMISSFPNYRYTDFVFYDNIKKKFGEIIKDVCALANSQGGTIYIGVNNSYRCIGVVAESGEEWLENILKLSRIIFNTIHTIEMKKIKYSIKNYIVQLNNVETYMAEIIVAHSQETCILNSFGNISCFERKDYMTITKPISEDVIRKIFLSPSDEIQYASKDVGDYYDGEESNTLEFKLSFNFLKDKFGIQKYISSFGNTQGGTLVVGVCNNGKISGILIEDSEKWDSLKCDILRNKNKINNIEFLTNINIEKIPLKKKNHYVVCIHIPKNTSDSPILAKDIDGFWNKWVRVDSHSVREDRLTLYSKMDISTIEKKCNNAETMYKQIAKENEILKENYPKNNLKLYLLGVAAAFLLISLK